MTAALKSYIPAPTPTHHRAADVVPHRHSFNRPPVAPQPVARVEKSSLRALPVNPQQASRSLRLLSSLQAVSSVLAASLVSLSLASYGASVYVDRQINQATQDFNRLQRNEEQLTTVNEVLKNYMAQQATQADAELQPPQPNGVIFLSPATSSLRTPHSSEASSSPLTLPNVQGPLGY